MFRRLLFCSAGLAVALCLLQCGTLATAVEAAASSDDTRSISGTVSSASAADVSELTVRAFEQDLTGTTLIGEALTDATGAYVITYESSDALDLLIRVLQDDTQLAESEVLFNADTDATIDVSLPATQSE